MTPASARRLRRRLEVKQMDAPSESAQRQRVDRVTVSADRAKVGQLNNAAQDSAP
jgi:hypothetical protein